MFPVVSSCEMEIAGIKRELNFRKVVLKDHAWCNQIFDNLEIHEVLMEKAEDLDSICRLIYNQLTEETKKLFAARRMETTDEDGNTTISEIGGYKMLSFYLETNNDYGELLKAYQHCYLGSLPIKKKMKKKAKAVIKKLRGH